MPYCTGCGTETLATDRFCPNCGKSLVSAGPGAFQTQSPQQPGSSPQRSKSPIGAAVLNLFLPGVGYIYNGIGRDAGELVFGILVFIFFFIGFEVFFIGTLLTTSPATTTTTHASPYDALILLVFLLPFAFAYDGYRRAKFD